MQSAGCGLASCYSFHVKGDNVRNVDICYFRLFGYNGLRGKPSHFNVIFKKSHFTLLHLAMLVNDCSLEGKDKFHPWVNIFE